MNIPRLRYRFLLGLFPHLNLRLLERQSGRGVPSMQRQEANRARLAAWPEQCRASYEGSNGMLLYKTPAFDPVVKRRVPMHRSVIIDLYSSLLVALKKYVANLWIIGHSCPKPANVKLVVA